MKFSGKMGHMMVLKVTKKQGFTLSLEDTFFAQKEGYSHNAFLLLSALNKDVLQETKNSNLFI